MIFKKISDQKLDKNLKALAKGEREILSEIILHIVEVERRKLYLKFGFPSLFEYLTKSIGYSNASAQRRIDAARLSFEVPEVIEKIESGEINLSQVSLLQKSLREVQAKSNPQDTNQKVNSETKKQLVEELSCKSFAESEVLVSKTLNIEPKQSTNIKNQKDESVRLEVTFTKSQWEKLKEMRELISHSLPNGSNWDQVFEYVSDKVIKQKDKARVIKQKNALPSKGKTKNRTDTASATVTGAENIKLNPTRTHIPASTQRKIHQRDQCCQYKDKLTGKQCTSKWKLTIDHIRPVWAGGSNELENLRVLCASHNQERYRNQANIQRAGTNRILEVDGLVRLTR